jgi:hypothetical protein
MVFEGDRDAFIDEIAGELRRPVRLDPRFDERVLAAIETPDVIPIRRTRMRSWADRRWTISVTPVGGLAAAAAIGAIVLGGLRLTGVSAGTPGLAQESTVGAPVIPVSNTGLNAPVERQFTILVPSASRVAIIGDFNDWDPESGRMQRLSDDGLWSVTLPLRAGRHEYQFLVDDTLHVPDPRAPRTSSDFGSVNSVVTVAPRVR